MGALVGSISCCYLPVLKHSDTLRMDNQGHPPVKAAVPPQTQLLRAELRPEHCIPNSSRLLVKDKLTNHASGVKKQVKKIQLLFHSLYPVSCSVLLPPCFGNKLRWQNAAFFKETVCRHCMAEVSLFIRDYDGVFHSFKRCLLLYCLHVSSKLSQGHNEK